jgi:hypothetical protein
LQASRASDTETLQSQVNKAAKKRLSLSGLEILHGIRIIRSCRSNHAGRRSRALEVLCDSQRETRRRRGALAVALGDREQ